MKRLVPFLGAVVVLAGCASAPEHHPPRVEFDTPEEWTAGGVNHADSTATEWWTSFGDTSLDTMVEEALVHNLDVLAAAARVNQAAAQAKIVGADLWPQAGANVTAGRARNNIIGFPTPDGSNIIETRSSSFGVSLDLSWEIDLWGRIRKGKEAAVADVQASWADLSAIRLSIAAQTTKAWLAVIEAREQVTLGTAIVESFASSADRVRRRYEEGVVSSVDLRLALSALANSRALLELRKQRFDGATRQLEILLGRYPGAQVATNHPLPVVHASVPGALPSELLTRRPDLLAAERRYAAAESRVSQARRAFFPRITLTGGAGTLSNELEGLTDLDFGVWNIAAGLFQPIFQGGRLKGNLERSHAVSDQALVAYVRSLLNAFGEVELSIVAEHSLVEQQRHLAEAARQSEAARQLAEKQYAAGIIDYITVLETQRQSFTARINLLTIQRERLDARVNLHVALGGGFDLSEEWMTYLETETAENGGSR